MKNNAAMRKLLTNMIFTVPMKSALDEIVEKGFETSDSCHFLAALFSKTMNVTRANFPDCTGYECFVNSIHIEDYDNKNPLCQAIKFISCVFEAWRTSMPALKLVSIISVDEFSVVVKFHTKRPEENWLNENIEKYENPVMSIESSENLEWIFSH
jgi:hypothetical protein